MFFYIQILWDPDSTNMDQVHRSSHIEHLQANMLGNLTVPCVALVYTKGEVLGFGTTVCRQKLKKTLKCKCTCTADTNETWDNVLKSEQLDIITSQEKAFDMTVIEEIGVLNLQI